MNDDKARVYSQFFQSFIDVILMLNKRIGFVLNSTPQGCRWTTFRDVLKKYLKRSIPFYLISLVTGGWGCEAFSEELVRPEENAAGKVEAPLDADMLEFLSEFQGLDDEQFEIILYHGNEDAKKQALYDEKEKQKARVEVRDE